MKDALIQDTATALLKQVKADDKFRADFVRALAAVYDAGAATVPPAVVAPMTGEEIAAFRAFARSAK